MDLTSSASSETYRCRYVGSQYEQAKALWSRVVGRKKELASDPSASQNVDPVPLVFLQQWKCYFTFCRYTILHELDWREVFAYMTNALPSSIETTFTGSKDSFSVASAAGTGLGHYNMYGKAPLSTTMMDAYHPSALTLISTLANHSERRFGKHPLSSHHQRLLHWTKMLAQCIIERLSDVFNKNEYVPLKELRWYRLVFASRAREVAGAAADVRALMKLLEFGENREPNNSSPRNGEDGLASTSLNENVVLTMTLSMTLGRSCIRTISPSHSFPSLTARTLDTLWVDLLYIPLDVLDPKCMPEKVDTKLVAVLDNRPCQVPDNLLLTRDGIVDNNDRIHSATLKIFLDAVDKKKEAIVRNPLVAIVTSSLPPLQSLEPYQLHCVIHLMETVGYVILTKVRSCCIEKCYYMLPFLLDFATSKALVKKAMLFYSKTAVHSVPSKTGNSEGEGVSLELTEMLFQALLVATEEFYTKCVNELFAVYSKGKRKHRVVEVLVSGRKVLISRTLLCLLQSIVEPTLEVLLLLLKSDLSSRKNRHFVRLIIDMLKIVLDEKMEAVGMQCEAGSHNWQQHRSDNALLRGYIDAHPLLQLMASGA